jgi:hypothetical protein
LKAGRKYEAFYEHQIPQKIYFNDSGEFSKTEDTARYDQWGWFISSPLLLDPTAGIIYKSQYGKETTKLMRLGNEGRSTASTIVSLSVVKALKDQGESYKNQKLLSFSDNRQDASLQSGHFNDFMSIVRLRSALYQALSEHKKISVSDISHYVVNKLDLKESEYLPDDIAKDDNPDPFNRHILEKYILVLLLRDLERSWQYTLPNLEQCGLLEIDYSGLDSVLQDDRLGELDLFHLLETGMRKDILMQLLDYFRTSYAIHHPYLLGESSKVVDDIKNRLDKSKPWSFSEQDRIESPRYLRIINPGRTKPGIFTASLGAQSYVYRYFKNLFKKHNAGDFNRDVYEDLMESICNILVSHHILVKDTIKGNKETVFGYLLDSFKVVWKLADKDSITPDMIRILSYMKIKLKANAFFRNLYSYDFTNFGKEIRSAEHTGQIKNLDRINRENDFRSGKLSTLFCSPTMELGIDISELNVVHMRNVPPNPANYAQRSGRAGRSGQTAIVFTYCSSFSPHDQTFFRDRIKMVAGKVVPPNIDLCNEELTLTHFNAFILMNLMLSDIRTSVAEVLDLTNSHELPVKADIKEKINHFISSDKESLISSFRAILLDLEPQLENVHWFNKSWFAKHVDNFYLSFDKSFDRWRALYRNANETKNKARDVMDNPVLKNNSDEKKEALKQEINALKQISLLKNESSQSSSNSEFYVFRYLASEGFLPGYNFTRLPVRVFAGYKFKEDGEYISRSRFIALSEYGPQNLIYHNGSRYEMKKLILPDAKLNTTRMKVSTKSGYAFLGDKIKESNNDPITNDQIKSDSAYLFSNIVEMSDSEAWPKDRISCNEEERMRKGFDIDQFFHYPMGINSTYRAVIKEAGAKLMNIIFCRATELIQVNKKWNRARFGTDEEIGFIIDKRNGKWLMKKDLENDEVSENKEVIQLFARDTADTIYIQPFKDLVDDRSQVITFSYALKRAIELHFQIEENEIGVWVMGVQDIPNIMLYEASEGSLGVLSQLIEKKSLFNVLFERAYRILHFNPDTLEDTRPDLPSASYEDILSYYNQRHHEDLNRFAVKEMIERLMKCTVQQMYASGDYDQHYQYLLDNYDKNSELELKFINYLYENGYRLPDIAQKNMDDYYISVDFVYKMNSGYTLIFCDGSVHDSPAQMKEDNLKRQALRDAGFDVIIWHYSKKIEDLINERSDIFVKV